MGSYKFAEIVNRHVLENMSDQVLEEYVYRTSVVKAINDAVITSGPKWEDINIFEWWRVSSIFADEARKAGEIIAETTLGTLWGRQNAGQPVSQDLNVQDIVKAIHAI